MIWQSPAMLGFALLSPAAAWLAWLAWRPRRMEVSSLWLWRGLMSASRLRQWKRRVLAAAAIPLMTAVALAEPAFPPSAIPALLQVMVDNSPRMEARDLLLDGGTRRAGPTRLERADQIIAGLARRFPQARLHRTDAPRGGGGDGELAARLSERVREAASRGNAAVIWISDRPPPFSHDALAFAPTGGLADNPALLSAVIAGDADQPVLSATVARYAQSGDWPAPLPLRLYWRVNDAREDARLARPERPIRQDDRQGSENAFLAWSGELSPGEAIAIRANLPAEAWRRAGTAFLTDALGQPIEYGLSIDKHALTWPPGERTFRISPRLSRRTGGHIPLALRLAGGWLEVSWDTPAPARLTLTDDGSLLAREREIPDAATALSTAAQTEAAAARESFLWIFAPIPVNESGTWPSAGEFRTGIITPVRSAQPLAFHGAEPIDSLSDRAELDNPWPFLWSSLGEASGYADAMPPPRAGSRVWAMINWPDGESRPFAARWDYAADPSTGGDGQAPFRRVGYWAGWNDAWAFRPEFAALLAAFADALDPPGFSGLPGPDISDIRIPEAASPPNQSIIAPPYPVMASEAIFHDGIINELAIQFTPMPPDRHPGGAMEWNALAAMWPRALLAGSALLAAWLAFAKRA